MLGSILRIAGAVVMFVIAYAWRYLTFTGLTNDHYIHLARGKQMLLGEWPVRDFVDPGLPMMYVASAAAEVIGGPGLGPEVALVAGAFAVGAAWTFLAASRLARSLGIASVVTILEIASSPRSYSYPKVALYAVGGWMIMAVAAAPTTRRILLLSAWIAIAFLFRHDHGVYLGLGSAVALLLTSRHAGWRIALTRVGVLTAGAGAALLPWALFVSLHGGLLPYFLSAFQYTRPEAQATVLRSLPQFRLAPDGSLIRVQPVQRPTGRVRWTAQTSDAERRALEARYRLELVGQEGESEWRYRMHGDAAETRRALALDDHVRDIAEFPQVEPSAASRFLQSLSPARLAWDYPQENSEAWLFYVYYALPLVCLAVASGRTRLSRERWAGELAAVIGLSIMALAVDAGFLRNPLKARLPDVIGPSALLTAWLLGLAFASDWGRPLVRAGVRALAILLLVLSAAAIVIVSDVPEQFRRSGIPRGEAGIRARLDDLSTRLSLRYPTGDMVPTRYSGSLTPFFEYLERCTAPTDRLLMTAQNPDVFALARRGFAGGREGFVPGFYTSVIEQQRTIERLRRQSVPFALIVLDSYGGFRSSFPVIDEYLSRRYEFLAHVPVEETEGVRILVERSRQATGSDPSTGWPCFR